MMMTRGAESLVSGELAGEVTGVALVLVIGLETGVRCVCFVAADWSRFALANLRGVVVLERVRDAPVRPGADVNSVGDSSNML